jgi:hypothetical protein
MTAAMLPGSGTEPLAPMRTALSEHFAAALRRHARAEAMPAFAHQFARLIGPFHGVFSAARQRAPADRGNIKSICAIGAAYTRALPARQCECNIMPVRHDSGRFAFCAAIFAYPSWHELKEKQKRGMGLMEPGLRPPAVFQPGPQRWETRWQVPIFVGV